MEFEVSLGYRKQTTTTMKNYHRKHKQGGKAGRGEWRRKKRGKKDKKRKPRPTFTDFSII